MIYIVDIEPVETRYTAQWQKHIPKIIKDYYEQDAINISGNIKSAETTSPGAFLNFGATNIYKSEQVIKIANLIQDGTIKNGDHILFTDAWHPGIINIKYIIDLLELDITLHGFWHAGSYDSNDFLGRKIKNKHWSYNFESSVFHALDYNYFATQYHIELFSNKILEYNQTFREYTHIFHDKILQTGWPMSYLQKELKSYQNLKKKDLIVFPHRIAPEKQPEIFKDLKQSLPEYEFIICQEQKLTKQEYHTLLSQSKIVFSANLQETLGISMYEGTILNSIPMVPDRLSYSEMFDFEYKYPDEWTKDFEQYLYHKDKLIDLIHFNMKNHKELSKNLPELERKLKNKFFTLNNFNI